MIDFLDDLNFVSYLYKNKIKQEVDIFKKCCSIFLNNSLPVVNQETNFYFHFFPLIGRE